MDSDADRLAMIKSLGGQLVRHDSGQFWAIFDREFVDIEGVESRQPTLIARTTDVSNLTKDAVLSIGDSELRVRRHEPDGTGMTQLVLRA